MTQIFKKQTLRRWKTNSIILSVVLHSAMLFSQSEKVLDSEIKRVTVYQQGAFVTRQVKCILPAGKSNLLFNSLSDKIDPKNIQVKIDNDNVIIVSVTHAYDYMNSNKIDNEIEALYAEKLNLIDSLKIINNLKNVFIQEKDMILSNKSIGGNGGVNINELQNAATFFRTRLTEIETQSHELDRNLFLIKEKLVKVSNQLLELNRQVNVPTSVITIVVSSEKAVETDVELTYLIREASWIPFYDVRIKDIVNPLTLTYKAKVNQNTGEDWKNVFLTLSTGNPTISNTKPNLDTYFLTFDNYYTKNYALVSSTNGYSPLRISGRVTENASNEPLIGCNVIVKGAPIGTVTDIDGKFNIEIPDRNAIIQFSYVGHQTTELPATASFSNVKLMESHILDEVVMLGSRSAGLSNHVDGIAIQKKKEMIPLAIQKHETSTEFSIDIPYTIISDGKDYDVSMVQYTIPVIYSYYAVPKISSDVFLVAKFTDWAQYHLLNGKANLFFKDSYQGDSYLDFTAFDDTLSISIGRDKDIVIDREIHKDFTSKSFFSNYKKEVKGWSINIKNNSENNIQLVVEDQYPISKSDDIKVELIDSSSAQTEENSGKLIWNLDIEPQEKKSLALKYSVKYPKSRKVLVE